MQISTRAGRRPTLIFAVMTALSCGGSAGQTSPFQITLRYQTSASDLTTTQRQALEDAKNKLEEIILNDMSVVNVDTICQDDAAQETIPIRETVSGLVILVKVVKFNNSSLLAASGPCILRGTTHFPLMAVLDINSEATMSDSQFQTVALHEMFHTLGFGTLWGPPDPVKGFGFNLLNDIGSADVSFKGQNALRAATSPSVNGTTETEDWTSVPVESGGGVGTASFHWRASVFGNELMTGWASGGSQPLSATTIESLADLGYTVDVSQADSSYKIPGSAMWEELSSSTAISLGDDVIHAAPVEVDEE